MEHKDHYATLGVAATASRDEIRRAYRRLARQTHPDLNKEPGAVARFQAVAEAHEALIDPERRAAHDLAARRHTAGGAPDPHFSDGLGAEAYGDLINRLFRRPGQARAPARGGADHHAPIEVDLRDVYRGARRTYTVSRPGPPGGAAVDVQVELNIPKGVRAGQRLRLAGMGGAGRAGTPAGDLYLEVQLRADPRFRVDDRDVFVELLLSPWEAALGGTVPAPTPEGEVQLDIPPHSVAGRQLRLKGRGLPGAPAGDLYAVLRVVQPPADSAAARAAYAAMAQAFTGFDPRAAAPAP